ncbi:hypothetical protein M0R89_11590 [Halorussus limi]|uniref:Uncharacterized protein n=1 Tax=Halorussus limi TaxID=2938695 RepID=A0A8U0HQG6_9EURY|nr:hypothetical protein [Halorussus limi]UPV73190.1 hypothetical protein M0R89_11590 [Halorussus limi]
MGVADTPRHAEQRQKAVAEIVRAHELVVDEWPDERLERVRPALRHDPLHRSLDPSPVEREFLAAVEAKREEVEVEPVTMRPSRYAPRVRAGWRVVNADD